MTNQNENETEVFGVELSASTIYVAMRNAEIKFVSAENNRAHPVLQQHYRGGSNLAKLV